MKTLTLILILDEDSNVPALGSLWIFPGDGRADQLEHKLSGWAKIVGPIEVNLALEIYNSLREFFEKIGVNVLSEAIAD
jgi:hypothetical protein